jgi:D-glycero-D-manno-heptose 1,7-bisphosphate phosphatase
MSTPLAEKGLLILDRDGVINQDSSEFVKSADEWLPLDGSIDAIAALSEGGFTIAVATNQSGLSRGLFDSTALTAIHRKMQDLVSAAGGRIDRVVVCPHGPDDDCDCRKPKPGLFYQLGEYYGIPLGGVPAVGDSLRDIQAAEAAGARPILVRTGNGQRAANSLPPALSDIEVFDDLAAAATALLER